MTKRSSTKQNSSVSRRCRRGFTLIEMLVAIAVAITFVSGMFLSRGNFDSTVRLSSITRDVALLVRQAQTYGASGGSDIEIGEPHGIYLNDSNPEEIILYANNDNSEGFDGTPDDEIVETFTLPEPFTVSDFCLEGTSSVSDCGSASANPNSLSVFFVRPSLEANFYHSGSVKPSSQAAIEITHESSGSTQLVIIDATGYISTP